MEFLIGFSIVAAIWGVVILIVRKSTRKTRNNGKPLANIIKFPVAVEKGLALSDEQIQNL